MSLKGSSSNTTLLDYCMVDERGEVRLLTVEEKAIL